MPINFDNVHITGGLVFAPEILTPSGDPYWANVSLLLNNTSTNNQTNNAFLDSSTNNYSITRNGTPTQGSFTPFTVAPNTSYSTIINGGSAYFLGSATNNLTAGTTSSFNFLHNSTALFTAEFWVYRLANNNEIIFSTNNGGSASIGAAAYFDVNSKIELFITRGVSGSPICTLTSVSSIALNTWTHVAITYDQSLANNNARIYINGTLDATGNKTANAPSSSNATTALTIGGASTYWLNGYLSSFRIVNSIVYSSNFTPSTTPLTAIANTSILLNFTNAGIYDADAASNLISFGDTKVSTTQAKFGTTSVYLDGTGDYLQTATTSLGFALGTTFTIEGWVYPTSFAGTPIIVDTRSSNETGFFAISTGGVLNAYVNNISTTLSATVALSLNTWSYVALVSDNTGTRIYINGTQRGTTATQASWPVTARKLTLGADFVGNQRLTGFLQDIRITKGVARYTANFTPPAVPFPTY